MATPTPRDEDLRRLVQQVVEGCISRCSGTSRRRLPQQKRSWWEVKHDESGPNFHEVSDEVDQWEAVCNKIRQQHLQKEMAQLVRHVQDSDELCEFLRPARVNENPMQLAIDRNMLVPGRVEFFVHEMTIYLLHSLGQSPFSQDKFDALYAELEAGLFERKVSVSIVVPILNVVFPSVTDDAPLELSEDMSLVALTNAMQIARVREPLLFAPPTVGRASHGLRFTARVPNTVDREAFFRAHEFARTLRVRVDAAFGLLKLAHRIDTGYFQYLVMADGWAHGWDDALPHIEMREWRDGTPSALYANLPEHIREDFARPKTIPKEGLSRSPEVRRHPRFRRSPRQGTPGTA